MSDTVLNVVLPAPAPIVVAVAGATPSAMEVTMLPRGPAGPAGSAARRADCVDNVSYCGRAPAGSAENQIVWTITRITVAGDGSVTTATAINVAWTERLTASYS